MSIESAKAFLERLRNDEDFRKSVGEIATAEERMEYIKGAGFDFTKEEINSVKDELSEEEISAVAGGKPIVPGWDSNYAGLDAYQFMR